MQPTQTAREQDNQDREREAGIREFVARHSHHRGLEVTLHLGDLRALLSLLDVERTKAAEQAELIYDLQGMLVDEQKHSNEIEAMDAQRGADAWAAVAVAWDAGYRAGCEDEKRDRGPIGGDGGPATRNPYLSYDEWGKPSFRVDVDAIEETA